MSILTGRGETGHKEVMELIYVILRGCIMVSVVGGSAKGGVRDSSCVSSASLDTSTEKCTHTNRHNQGQTLRNTRTLVVLNCGKPVYVCVGLRAKMELKMVKQRQQKHWHGQSNAT